MTYKFKKSIRNYRSLNTKRICHVLFRDLEVIMILGYPEAWYNFMSGRPLGSEELCELESKIPTLTENLEQKGCPKKDVLYFFKKKFKKLYHRTRSLKGQWDLMRSPLNKLFKIKFRKRLFYLITRGIL